MSTLSFRNGRIVTPEAVCDRLAMAIEDAQISGMDADAEHAAALDLEGGWLVPGFVDTQVNGGGDVLFNDAQDVATIARIGAAHVRYGTTAFLPTLISGTLNTIARALDAVDAAIAQGVPGAVGVHIEGPFLSVERKGIHDAGNFRPLDDAALALLTRPRRGVVMVTLAPEHSPPDAIRALADAGVIVSIGHSNASYEQTREAIRAGARGITHLFNAMSGLHHREPGVVGAALEDPSLYCGLIVDGAHVHPAAVRVALASRPLDRFMLVTDAMPSVGGERSEFMLNGELIRVEDGVCLNEAGTLAGCDLDMASAVRNMHGLGAPVEDALAMASTNPAAFLGLSNSIGHLAPGCNADFVWLDRDLKPRGTWIGGRRVA